MSNINPYQKQLTQNVVRFGLILIVHKISVSICESSRLSPDGLSGSEIGEVCDQDAKADMVVSDQREHAEWKGLAEVTNTISLHKTSSGKASDGGKLKGDHCTC